MSKAQMGDKAVGGQDSETIQDRLKQLFRQRTLRQVAADWELPYSTLNNYFTKGATPGLEIANRIACKENVSLEWMVRGSIAPVPEVPATPQDFEALHNPLQAAWIAIFNYCETAEIQALLRVIHKHGIRNVISNTEKDTGIDSQLMRLTYEEKQEIIEIYQRRRSCNPPD